jgi:hypothetical protein
MINLGLAKDSTVEIREYKASIKKRLINLKNILIPRLEKYPSIEIRRKKFFIFTVKLFQE